SSCPRWKNACACRAAAAHRWRRRRRASPKCCAASSRASRPCREAAKRRQLRELDPSTMNVSKVLVTGADGFIGSHLVEMLVAAGHDVTALAIYNSANDWGWLEAVNCRDRIRVERGDIRDPHFCRQIVAGQQVVFHLAALIAI